MKKYKICIVIPCYNVKEKIISVLKKIDYKMVDKVIIVDDCCPEKSGQFVKKNFKKKISFIFLKKILEWVEQLLLDLNMHIKKDMIL